MGVYGALVVVPLEFDADKKFSPQVDSDVVVLFKCGDKVVDVIVAFNFDFKVVNYQGEGDGSPYMLP